MSEHEVFLANCEAEVARQGADPEFADLTRKWMDAANAHRYSYHFTWMNRPIIQYPQDIIALQELIWKVKPDFIIETGVAHGGCLIYYASLLALLDMEEALRTGTTLDPKKSRRKVVGIDIDIRQHNRDAIEADPFSSYIELIQGSSVDADVVRRVQEMAKGHNTVFVSLDSNHTEDHVLAELDAYAPLVTKGSYCIAFDTVIERLPGEFFNDRDWTPTKNPATAVRQWIKSHPGFVVDSKVDHKISISVAPGGYLQRIA